MTDQYKADAQCIDYLQRALDAAVERANKLQDENRNLRSRLSVRGLPAGFDEALNSGDGVYRP